MQMPKIQVGFEVKVLCRKITVNGFDFG